MGAADSEAIVGPGRSGQPGKRVGAEGGRVTVVYGPTAATGPATGPAAPRRTASMPRMAMAVLAGLMITSEPLRAQAPPPSGFLCCNLRVYNDWVSDINYRHDGSRVLAAGTPVRGLSWGRYSLEMQVGQQKLWLGNDYSRSLADRPFSRRYIVADDPRRRLAAAEPFVRDAVRRSQVMDGMRDDEVAMALGYPVANYTPELGARQWKYWIDRTGEFAVNFDRDRRVVSVTGEPRALGVVVYVPGNDVVRRAQERLGAYGFDPGAADGRLGPTTRKALREFQSLNGLRESGRFDAATLGRLGVGP